MKNCEFINQNTYDLLKQLDKREDLIRAYPEHPSAFHCCLIAIDRIRAAYKAVRGVTMAYVYVVSVFEHLSNAAAGILWRWGQSIVHDVQHICTVQVVAEQSQVLKSPSGRVVDADQLDDREWRPVIVGW